jgi:SulP family sulfate permease
MRHDFIAGITGAVIVLPQGVAFAMIAGLPPIYGLYTAMITPVIAALFGSSYHLVSGPTTAISILIFGALQHLAPPGSGEFIGLALTMTFMAGLIQFIMGLARLGSLVNFVSHTVIMGFTAGAAVLIATKQLKYAVGIEVPQGSKFYEIIYVLVSKIGSANWKIIVVAFGTLLLALILKKIWSKLPNLLMAMVGGSLINLALGGMGNGVPLVGEMSATLPTFAIPNMSWETIQTLMPNAFAIALLGLISSVAIAKSIGLKSGQNIDGNQEFIGQGLSNIVGGTLGCYAGAGSFTRSGLNYDTGAKTPLSAVFAAVILGAILIFIAPYTAYLPIPAMAGVIILVGYDLIDFKGIRSITKISGRESVVLGITFLATLFLQLEFAIYIGVIFSLIFYLQTTSKPRLVPLGFIEKNGERRIVSSIRKKSTTQIEGLAMRRIDGSLFFGSTEHVMHEFKRISAKHNHVLLDCGGINTIDMAGAELLVTLADELREKGGGLYVFGMKRPVRQYLMRGKYWRAIETAHMFEEGMTAVEWFENLNPKS